MFNLQGSEIIIILLLALVVLGPEKLPDAMRRAGRMYADLKKMATGFQDEFRSALDEPMREMSETANMLRDSADFTRLANGNRPEKSHSATMGDASSLAPIDPEQLPVDELPFRPTNATEPPAGSDEFEQLPEPPTDGEVDHDERPRPGRNRSIDHDPGHDTDGLHGSAGSDVGEPAVGDDTTI